MQAIAVTMHRARLGCGCSPRDRSVAVNAVLAAVGYNFRSLLAWLAILVRWFLLALSGEPAPASGSILTVSVSHAPRSGFFTDDYNCIFVTN